MQGIACHVIWHMHIFIWRIRQTAERDEVPCMSKNVAKGVPWALKSDRGILTKRQYMTSLIFGSTVPLNRYLTDLLQNTKLGI